MRSVIRQRPTSYPNRAFLAGAFVLLAWLGAACSTGPLAPVSPSAPTVATDANTPPRAETAATPPNTEVEELTPAEAQSTYHGAVTPIDQITVTAQTSGLVRALPVAVGDAIAPGELIARLDSTLLEASRAAALAGLEAAQARLAILLLPPDESEIEAARAAVTAAEAAYRRAVAGPTRAEVAAAEMAVLEAEAKLNRAQAAYDQLAWNPLVANLPEGRQLQEAQLAFDEARAWHDSLAYAGSTDAIAAAYARLAEARAHLRRLEDGPDPAERQAAEAQVRQAETALYLAQLDLDNATVRAPIGGIVAQIYTAVGSRVAPGDPLARIISPDTQIVIDVDESHLQTIAAGQPVEIQLSAYPGQVYTGEIAAIAPEVDAASQRVKVTVRPTDPAAPLLPGMEAMVTLVDR